MFLQRPTASCERRQQRAQPQRGGPEEACLLRQSRLLVRLTVPEDWRRAVDWVGPHCGVFQHTLDILVVVRRVRLVSWPKVKDPPAPAMKCTAAAKYFAPFEPTHKHQFVGVRNVEEFTIHFFSFQFNRFAEPRRNRMTGIDDPQSLVVIRFPPFEVARCPHQPLERFGEVSGMQHDKPHSVKHATNHTPNDFVRHLAVCHMAPPKKHIGTVQNRLRQSMLRFIQRGRFDYKRRVVSKDSCDDFVDTVRINSLNGLMLLLVAKFIPNRDANRLCQRRSPPVVEFAVDPSLNTAQYTKFPLNRYRNCGRHCTSRHCRDCLSVRPSRIADVRLHIHLSITIHCDIADMRPVGGDASLLSLTIALASLVRDFTLVSGYVNQSFPQPLSKEEEQLYFERWRTGDRDAYHVLIEHNLRLVAHVAKKFDSCGIDHDDLISIGTVGLIKAVETYQPAKGTKFATYAARCIQNEILMQIRTLKKTRKDVSLFSPIGMDKEGNEIWLERYPFSRVATQLTHTLFCFLLERPWRAAGSAAVPPGVPVVAIPNPFLTKLVQA